MVSCCSMNVCLCISHPLSTVFLIFTIIEQSESMSGIVKKHRTVVSRTIYNFRKAGRFIEQMY